VHADQPLELRRALRSFLAEMEAHLQSAVAHAAAQLPPGVILTHSHSSLVVKALVAATRQSIGCTVVCTTAYPGGEGIACAQALTQAGVPVTLVADLQAFAWLPRCALFLVGADALCEDGLVHKVGTAPLAKAAQAAGVPVWSIATSEKRLPLPWQEALRGEAPALVRTNIPQDRTLYDLTPWEHVNTVVLETGPVAGRAVWPRTP